jgi:beta-carotene ketolase (CrtO type)
MSRSDRRDVVVIGAGHNGLVCAAYLARAGLDVIVVEAADALGGCIHTVELPAGAGRLELGAYEIGGIVGSGVADDLELTTRWGLDLIDRAEFVYAPAAASPAVALHCDLATTVDLVGSSLGKLAAEQYRSFAKWSASLAQLLHMLQARPAPSMPQLAALARLTLGTDGGHIVHALLAPASTLLRAAFDSEPLRAVLGHWSALPHLDPAYPGSGLGAFQLAGLHGHPGKRPRGGSRTLIDSLRRCVEAHGGLIRSGAAVTRIEISDGRANAVICADQRYVATRAIVASIDAARVFTDLVDPGSVPSSLRRELADIHSGHGNVTELKIDAVVRSDLPRTVPAGFERAFIVSSSSLDELEHAFAEIRLGLQPRRPPLMIAFASALEDGWAPAGDNVAWIQTIVPSTPATGRWDDQHLAAAADHTWSAVEQLLGPLDVVKRVITGPQQWTLRHGSRAANPNHIDMTLDQLLDMRPSPSLSKYTTPIPGLYLSGAGTHPGGGVTGAPGRNTAKRILWDLNRHRPRTWTSHARETAALLRDSWRALRTLRAR